MSSPEAHRHRVARAPASHPVFPDEILEEIFLRLDAAEGLARASAACTTFRRAVSARSFLHRFRCLHAPPVLGVLEFDAPGPGAFLPAEPPHRAAPAARALAQASDFTFSFLGTPHFWRVCDARDSRVLLRRGRVTSLTSLSADLVVCDPLHRRHVELPAIPDNLAAATGCWRMLLMQEFDSFLDPDTGKDKEKQDLSFRVICAVQCQHKLVTFHFSSVTGQWRGIMFNRPVPFDSSSLKLFERHYAHGCYFWTIPYGGCMLILNMHDMELSVVDLPPGLYGLKQRVIVEAGGGMIGLFTLSDSMLQLYCKSLRGTEWHHERIIPLPELNSYWSIDDATAGYLLLKATPWDYLHIAKRESQYFTLNLKTFLVEALCVTNQHNTGARLYVSFPSPFSLPSICYGRSGRPGRLPTSCLARWLQYTTATQDLTATGNDATYL